MAKGARKALPEAVLQFFREEGAKGGRKGGALAWKNLTPAQRSARAKKASAAAVKARKAAKRKT